jgi:hypothetical protein
LEDLSDASLLGKLLVLPANVRLDWKVFARHKHCSLFGLVISNEEKKFYNIDTWCQCYKNFYLRHSQRGLVRQNVDLWQDFPAWGESHKTFLV